jgi:hypothetical protein
LLAAAAVLLPVSSGHIKAAGRAVSGSYTVLFKSGMKYHGKGSPQRATRSGRELSAAHGDAVKSIDHTPAASHSEGFVDEAKRIRADGGVDNPGNYNRINSPGEKILTKQEARP